MASSKVMACTSPSNPDLPRQSSCLHLLTDLHSKTTFSCMNMDDLLKTIYSDSDHFPADDVSKKSVDEVWKEIVNQPVSNQQPAMTLEDFLTKAGAVREEDVKENSSSGVFGNQDGVIAYPVVPAANQVVFGNGMDGRIVARGKRRAVEEAPVDKATQQKQRRMIKNRESAARSRERKQAYTVELESLVTHLEEENARLMQEEAEQTKERFKQVYAPNWILVGKLTPQLAKEYSYTPEDRLLRLILGIQLMENLIPVVEKKRPPRVLRRVHSM